MALAVCSGLFAVGIVLGVASAYTSLEDISESTFMQEYLQSLGLSFSSHDLFAILWEISKDILIAFICGFSFLGVLAIPILAVYRGFSLAFAFSALICSINSDGAIYAVLLFALRSLVIIPCFFLISTQSLCAAKDLAFVSIFHRQSNGNEIYNRRYFLKAGIVFSVLVIAGVFEKYVFQRILNILL